MAKYRKRPVVIEVEAERFDSNKPEHEWPFGVQWEPVIVEQDGGRYGGYHYVQLFGGFIHINNGSWVLYHGSGKRTVMTDHEFQKVYEPVTTKKQEGVMTERKCLNMIWANESGISVYVYEGEHGRRGIEIHRVNAKGHEEIAATATIEKHNRERMVECFADTEEERMAKFVQRFNATDKDLEELSKIKPPVKSDD